MRSTPLRGATCTPTAQPRLLARGSPALVCLAFVAWPALLLAACGGSSGTSPADIAASTPDEMVVTEIAPALGPAEGGTRLRIQGRGFLSGGMPKDVTVLVGARAVPGTVLSDTELEATTPPAAYVGLSDVIVVIDRRAARLADAFERSAPDPRATLVPPVGRYDEYAGGTQITATLAHAPDLGMTPTVLVSGFAAEDVEVLGVDRLRFQLPVDVGPPSMHQGTQIVTITNQGVTAAGNVQLVPPPESGALVINEFLPSPGTLDANRDGVSDTTGDEFIEIVNRGSQAVDLGGMQLTDASAVRHVFPNPSVVPAGGAIVVFGFGNSQGFAPPGASGQTQVASSGSLGMNNGTDVVRLMGTDGLTIVFEVAYTSSEVEAGRSLNLLSDGAAVASPAEAASTYVFHDTLGAAPASPGVRTDGTPF